MRTHRLAAWQAAAVGAVKTDRLEAQASDTTLRLQVSVGDALAVGKRVAHVHGDFKALRVRQALLRAKVSQRVGKGSKSVRTERGQRASGHACPTP